jgi:hypothetical protein
VDAIASGKIGTHANNCNVRTSKSNPSVWYMGILWLGFYELVIFEEEPLAFGCQLVPSFLSFFLPFYIFYLFIIYYYYFILFFGHCPPKQEGYCV